MSKIEELIEKLCPNGVEYKTIGEVATYRRGSFPQPYTNSLFYGGEGAMPFVQVADIEDSGFKLKEKTKQTISKIAQLKSIYVPKETVICSIQGTIGRVAITQYDSYIDRTIAIFESFKIEINKRFFAYCIELKFGIEKQFARGSTLKTITKEEFTKFSIPVPPLEVQCEIVHILDDFTLLSAELSAELKARQKQFTYFEEKLLFNNNFEKVKLADLCIVNQGLQIPINQRKKKPAENRYFYITVQFLKGGDEKYYIESPQPNVICKKEDILVTRTGSTGKVITGVEGCFHNNFFKVEPNERILKRYLYFVLNSKRMYNKMLRAASGGTVPDLPHRKFYNLEIFLPSIEEQEKIINILDSFEKLCNDISEGLPAEIEARQKQYKYYRDKLLTFKELKVNE